VRFSALYQHVFGDRVPSGPFRGMRHPAREVGSAKGIGARILGTYECELREIVEELCRRPHARIINIGAGEGYYAIGFALRLPGAAIHAFEADPETRRCLEENVRSNSVESRVHIQGECGVAELASTLADGLRSLVVIDAEGAELGLLDPVLIPALIEAEILVEIHDFVSADIGSEIARRFAQTHSLREIWTRPRSVGDLPAGPFRWLSFFLPGRGVRWLDEGRNQRMRWFFLDPKRPA
jgi:hypothetical protein